MEWILILTLWHPGNGGGVESIQVETKKQCEDLGKQWASQRYHYYRCLDNRKWPDSEPITGNYQ